MGRVNPNHRPADHESAAATDDLALLPMSEHPRGRAESAVEPALDQGAF